MKKSSKATQSKATLTHTTSGGHKITIKPVPPFLMDNLMQSVKYPEIPTYEAKTASGEVEVHPHDETTLETPEDKAAWKQYEQDLVAAQERENELLMNSMLLKGIDVDMDSQAFEDWKDEQEFLGQDLPTSKAALKVRYVSTEILSDFNDLSIIMGLIMQQSGVSEEVVAKAQSSFQGAISRVTSGEAAAETGEVEAQ